MTDTAHFIRPMKPEAVAWTDCPEEERERLEEKGLIPCDREVYEIHTRIHGSEDDGS